MTSPGASIKGAAPTGPQSTPGEKDELHHSLIALGSGLKSISSGGRGQPCAFDGVTMKTLPIATSAAKTARPVAEMRFAVVRLSSIVVPFEQVVISTLRFNTPPLCVAAAGTRNSRLGDHWPPPSAPPAPAVGSVPRPVLAMLCVPSADPSLVKGAPLARFILSLVGASFSRRIDHHSHTPGNL